MVALSTAIALGVRFVVFVVRSINLGIRLVVFVVRFIDLKVRSFDLRVEPLVVIVVVVVVVAGKVLPARLFLPLLLLQPLLDRGSVQTILEMLLKLSLHITADGIVSFLGTVVAPDARQVLEFDALGDDVAGVWILERARRW